MSCILTSNSSSGSFFNALCGGAAISDAIVNEQCYIVVHKTCYGITHVQNLVLWFCPKKYLVAHRGKNSVHVIRAAWFGYATEDNFSLWYVILNENLFASWESLCWFNWANKVASRQVLFPWVNLFGVSLDKTGSKILRHTIVVVLSLELPIRDGDFIDTATNNDNNACEAVIVTGLIEFFTVIIGCKDWPAMSLAGSKEVIGKSVYYFVTIFSGPRLLTDFPFDPGENMFIVNSFRPFIVLGERDPRINVKPVSFKNSNKIHYFQLYDSSMGSWTVVGKKEGCKCVLSCNSFQPDGAFRNYYLSLGRMHFRGTYNGLYTATENCKVTLLAAPITISRLMRFSSIEKAFLRAGAARNIVVIVNEYLFDLKLGDYRYISGSRTASVKMSCSKRSGNNHAHSMFIQGLKIKALALTQVCGGDYNISRDPRILANYLNSVWADALGESENIILIMVTCQIACVSQSKSKPVHVAADMHNSTHLSAIPRSDMVQALCPSKFGVPMTSMLINIALCLHQEVAVVLRSLEELNTPINDALKSKIHNVLIICLLVLQSSFLTEFFAANSVGSDCMPWIEREKLGLVVYLSFKVTTRLPAEEYVSLYKNVALSSVTWRNLNLEDKVLIESGGNVMNPVLGLDEQRDSKILIDGPGLCIIMRASPRTRQANKNFNWDPG